MQLIRPINALDELCRLMKCLVHPKPGAGGSLGAGLIPVSSELCYRLGACQIAMCGTGMQRWAAAEGGLGSQRGVRARRQDGRVPVLVLCCLPALAGHRCSGRRLSVE